MGVLPPADDAVARFVRGRGRASGGLLLEGAAGIGKTYHYTLAVKALTEAGWRVLEARPSEAEFRLGGCGLIDLLATVQDAELDDLPPPQRAALRVALLRESAGPDVTDDADPRVVAVALTTLVRQLAGRRPLALVVDDLQWLDPATESALAFLLRRVPEKDVAFVGTLRTPGPDPLSASELESRGYLTRVEVPPLSPAAVSELVESSVDIRLPAPLLARAAETSGGNPFYAVELARTWSRAAAALLDTLPVPDSLQSLVGVRLQQLTEESRRAITAAAAMRRPTEAVLRRLGLASGLPEAERAGVVTVTGGELRFSHPLLAAAAYDSLTGTERADLHRVLAEVDDDLEARARHLALAASGTDAGLAAELDGARQAAARRGDPHAAFELARLALRVTAPDDPSGPERRLALAQLELRVGDGDAADEELAALDADTVPALVRGRALVLRCELAFSVAGPQAARAFGERALAIGESLQDAALVADAHIYLCQASQEDLVRATEHAQRAVEAVDGLENPGPSRLAQSHALAGGQKFRCGLGLDHALFERAVQIETEAGVPAEEMSIGYYAAMLGYSDEIDRSEAVLTSWRRVLTEQVCESQLPFLLMWETNHALKTGRIDDAAQLADAHHDHASRLGFGHNARYAAFNHGRVALARGDALAATAIGDELLAAGRAAGVGPIENLGARLLAEAAIHLGEIDQARVHLDGVLAFAAGSSEDVYAYPHVPLLVEALSAAGELDRAEQLLADYERRADRQGSASARGLAFRARGLVAAARGAEEDSLAAFDASLASYDVDPRLYPHERARTLLLKGMAQRRAKRRSAARETLAAARATYAALGSSGWVARVDAEIDRTGVRRATSTELTASELRVAELAANGMTAKEIAAAMFLSPRTVEDNLARIYRKLGIRSRAELGARLTSLTRP